MVETHNRPPKTLEEKLERLFMKLGCLKAPVHLKEFWKQHESTGQDTFTENVSENPRLSSLDDMWA